MYQSESIHTYPRPITTLIEWLCAALVAITSARLGFIFLRALWDIYGRDDALITQVPLLPAIADWVNGSGRPRASDLGDLWPALLPSLGWAALALLATIMLRNALPAIRTNSQGMLVEFAGSWLPVPWEHLKAIKVTSDPAAERFALVAQTDRRQLTTWHRLYSLFYGLSLQHGFYITSSISEFDKLVKTMIGESERTARGSETARPLSFQENAPSLLFRLLLSPGTFFSQSAAGDVVAGAARQPLRPGGPVAAAYPSRISALIGAATALLALAAVWRYLGYWSRFIALEIAGLRTLPPFRWHFTDPAYIELYNAFRTRAVPFMGVAGRPDLPAPWWLLVAAHLMLLLAIVALLWLRGLLPNLESRSDGLAVYDSLRSRWRLLPWAKVRALKLTELSEQSQIVLVQSPGLPAAQRLTSLLYDGSASPGVLITSAVDNFQPMLEHALGNLAPLEQASGRPILRQEARSPLLWQAFSGRAARDELVATAREDATTRVIAAAPLLRAARTMAALALPPALLALLGGLLAERAPSFSLIAGVLVLWLFGMLEWPLVGLVSVLLDDNTGGGEEGYRALYLYPASQLPRLLPLVAAVVLQIVGVPVLPALAWLSAIVWAYWLGAGLWVSLYDWRGSQAVLGGLLPVLWQLLLLIGYLVASR